MHESKHFLPGQFVHSVVFQDMDEILLKVALNTINHLYLISETVVTLSTPMSTFTTYDL
jgi:hypothetical protein